MRSVFNLRRFYYTRIPFGFLKVSYMSERQRAGINAEIQFSYKTFIADTKCFQKVSRDIKINVGLLVNPSTLNTGDAK